MSDDYLWDRSGEPDTETAQLERTLGRLRHQPKAIVLPAVAPPRRTFFPALAAAALVLLMLAGGLWLSLQRSINEETNSPRLLLARPVPSLLAGRMREPRQLVTHSTGGSNGYEQASLLSSSQPARKITPRRAIEEREEVLLPHTLASRRPRSKDQQMMRDGEAATEQLMLALRFASSKLNLVQKKVRVNKGGGPAS